MRKTLSEASFQIKLGLKVLQLVWESSPKWASFYFATNAASSITPATTLYIGKLTIDAIIIAIKNPTSAHITSIIVLACIAFLAEAANSLFGNLATHGFDVMKDIFSKFAIKKVIDHSASLDLSYFEDPNFHDQLEKVQREINYRPTQAMNVIVEVASSTIGLLSLLVILVRLSVWAPIVIAFFPSPAFFFV